MLELGYPVEADELKRNIQEIVKRGGTLIIAEEERVIVGSVCVMFDVRLAEGIYAEIVSLVVAASARGKGIGKGLVKKAEDWAKEKVHKVRVRANEVRHDAHLFYESQGYTRVKKQRIYIKMV
ncbi:MAG: GNAT family N-acetyltransferase [Desulfopila sp.]|jgi:GNAT superfamily N-acetyltransferase|nr:GNAT family N-acetyltransferase [Desulfopila sp.]